MFVLIKYWHFLVIIMNYSKYVGFLALLSLFVTGYLAFFWAPVEQTMGIVQKIMYIHVPTSWVTFLAFTVIFFCSIAYVWKREEKYDIIAASSAEIGIVFCALSIATGSIWGKPTWNTYWTWDARLTTTLILLLIYAGYFLLRYFIEEEEKRARYAAILGIVGFPDIFLIHLSVKWWRTLHQSSTMFSTKSNVIDTSFLITLWAAVLTITILYVYILLRRIELEKITRLYHFKISNLTA